MLRLNKTLVVILTDILLLAWGAGVFIAPVTYGLTEKPYQNRVDEPTPAALLKLVDSQPDPQTKPNIIVILG